MWRGRGKVDGASAVVSKGLTLLSESNMGSWISFRTTAIWDSTEIMPVPPSAFKVKGSLSFTPRTGDPGDGRNLLQQCVVQPFVR